MYYNRLFGKSQIYLPRPELLLDGFLLETWLLNLACCTVAVLVCGTFGFAAAVLAAIAAVMNGFLDFFSSVIDYLSYFSISKML